MRSGPSAYSVISVVFDALVPCTRPLNNYFLEMILLHYIYHKIVTTPYVHGFFKEEVRCWPRRHTTGVNFATDSAASYSQIMPGRVLTSRRSTNTKYCVLIWPANVPGRTFGDLCCCNLGPALLTLKGFYLKAFSRKHGCDWLMLKHQPITATLSAKSF